MYRTIPGIHVIMYVSNVTVLRTSTNLVRLLVTGGFGAHLGSYAHRLEIKEGKCKKPWQSCLATLFVFFFLFFFHYRFRRKEQRQVQVVLAFAFSNASLLLTFRPQFVTSSPNLGIWTWLATDLTSTSTNPSHSWQQSLHIFTNLLHFN